MKVGIVGLGLIGGSLGLDLRSLGFEVLGISRREKTCSRALDKKIVDEASVSLSLLRKADLVFVCTPLTAIAATVERLIPYLNPDAIITDVGSVKMPIIDPCSRLWANFVGGHPMAGTAEQGIAAAQKQLFSGAAYVLTPNPRTSVTALQRVQEIAQSLGAKTYICSPEIHDKAVAWISHLPLMVSAGLISSCVAEAEPEVLELARKLASSGFRDTSRVGGGNPELGLMIARYNRQALLRSLYQYRHSLNSIIEDIEQEDWGHLEEFLTSTKQERPLFINNPPP
ncbi:MAG: prephenate/arogenate dehydrogenase [Spirulinaceae cyanobacterium]